MRMNEYETYIDTIDEIENRVVDDDKFPVVKDNRIKTICRMILEFIKIVINYLMNINIDASEKEK